MLRRMMRKIEHILNENADDINDMSSYLNDVKDYEFIVSKYGEFSGVRVWFAVGSLSLYLDTTIAELSGATLMERERFTISSQACNAVNQIFKEIYKNEIQNKS